LKSIVILKPQLRVEMTSFDSHKQSRPYLISCWAQLTLGINLFTSGV